MPSIVDNYKIQLYLKEQNVVLAFKEIITLMIFPEIKITSFAMVF